MSAAKKKAPKTIRVQYVKSVIGKPENQRLVVKSLGLRKLNQIVERQDTPAVRGMVAKIPHLVKIIE
jgi:large subunit ribosomal protein L30